MIFAFDRYVALPSNTPYYYDPGSKFNENPSYPATSSFHDEPVDSEVAPFSQVSSSTMAGAIPLHPYRQNYPNQGQPSYGRSPLPYANPSPAPYLNQAYRGKPYSNMPSTGYDVEGPVFDESRSNLSSSENGNRFVNQPNQHEYQQYGSQQSYSIHYPPSYDLDGYSDLRTPAPYEGEQPQGPYEEDFAATNLLMSPAYSETGDYKHALERQMKQYQQQNQPTQSYQNDSENSSGNTAAESSDKNDPAYNEKLGTITEELDADEVVAEIDGLLL